MDNCGKEVIALILKELGIKAPTFANSIGVKYQRILDIQNGKTKKVSPIVANAIVEKYPQFNRIWLMTGEGEMLKNSVPTRRKIPVYDAESIGGLNNTVANMDGNAKVSEEIDAGDWFPEATAAIHHYGDSMVEYPSGSILALKRVHDFRLIINGRNYVVETTEYRITKQLQYNGGEYMMAYSTNTEKYPDGNLVHSPIKIPVETIRHIDLVLGCVTKEYSNGAVIIRKR